MTRTPRRITPLEYGIQMRTWLAPGTGEHGVPFNVSRMKHVLRQVSEKSGWGKQKFPRGQCIAIHFSHKGYIAEVTEVEALDSR